MKWLTSAVAIICLVVTCANVQALRDVYAPEPSPIEKVVVGLLSDIGGNHD